LARQLSFPRAPRRVDGGQGQKAHPEIAAGSFFSGGSAISLHFPVRQGKTPASHREVLRLWVVHQDGRGRLLGVELVFLGEGDADFLGAEQRQQLLLVGEVGAGGIVNLRRGGILLPSVARRFGAEKSLARL